MQTNDLHPPRSGLDADPILYGVAAGLAELFPPVALPRPTRSERDADTDGGPRDDAAAD